MHIPSQRWNEEKLDSFKIINFVLSVFVNTETISNFQIEPKEALYFPPEVKK